MPVLHFYGMVTGNMNPLVRFWQQPNKTHRNFQLVYTYLTLNFFLPSLVYTFAPGKAIGQFETLGQILGAGSYAALAGETGNVWRVLGAANVMTLSLMCCLLLVDLRRFYPVLLPLVFMKGFTAVLYLAVYLFENRYPAFLAVSLYDGFNLFLMLYFAIRAHRSLSAA